MKLKNYTSEVPVVRTVARIEELLAKFGASHIAKEYGNGGEVMSIQFMIVDNGKQHVIKLPANVKLVYEALRKRHPNMSSQRVQEQAGRTAWKLMQDWTEVQLTLIGMRQAEPMQVFMPYVWDGTQTFFEYVKGCEFKQLRNFNQPQLTAGGAS